MKLLIKLTFIFYVSACAAQEPDIHSFSQQKIDSLNNVIDSLNICIENQQVIIETKIINEDVIEAVDTFNVYQSQANGDIIRIKREGDNYFFNLQKGENDFRFSFINDSIAYYDSTGNRLNVIYNRYESGLE